MHIRFTRDHFRRRFRRSLPWTAVALAFGICAASAGINCSLDESNHQNPGEPSLEPISPHECTRWVSFRNCCRTWEQPACGVANNQIVLNVHWEITGDSECRAGWSWPGGSCHSPRCFNLFMTITDPPGESGDYNGDTYDQNLACKRKTTEHFGYNAKLVKTETFHYKGWCSVFGILRDLVEQDCSRTRTDKIENCVIHGWGGADCSDEEDCQ